MAEMDPGQQMEAARMTLLMVEDEPLILLDLELAAQDLGCEPICARNCDEALAMIEQHGASISAAILDVSLGESETCLPIARELERRSIPFVLHSGDLDRQEEQIRTLNGQIIAKPAPADDVVRAAMACADRRMDDRGSDDGDGANTVAAE